MVELMAMWLKGQASAWWEHAKVTHEQDRKSKVKIWDKIKSFLWEDFLLVKYVNFLRSQHTTKGTDL